MQGIKTKSETYQVTWFGIDREGLMRFEVISDLTLQQIFSSFSDETETETMEYSFDENVRTYSHYRLCGVQKTRDRRYTLILEKHENYE